jgi:Ca2+-binding RTX toxin-like protein
VSLSLDAYNGVRFVESLTLTGTAAINGTGNSLANTITGNSAANTLDGSSGADRLIGGDGNDIYVVDNAVEVVTETNASLTQIDEVRSSVTWTLGANLENLTLTGTTAINGTGNALANTLTGNASANTLKGEAGSDILYGGLGSDSLYGGAGDKVKDVFDFNAITESKAGTTRDKVYDFVTKIDKIDLSGIDANTATAKTGDQAFLFNNTSAKANSVWYKVADVDGSTSTKDIVIYGDVNGDAKADFEIGLVGVTSIAATDFVL